MLNLDPEGKCETEYGKCFQGVNKSPQSIMGYLCCVYREKIAQHVANNNADQKLFGGAGLQEVTQRVDTGQEMRIQVKGGVPQRWTEV